MLGNKFGSSARSVNAASGQDLSYLPHTVQTHLITDGVTHSALTGVITQKDNLSQTWPPLLHFRVHKSTMKTNQHGDLDPATHSWHIAASLLTLFPCHVLKVGPAKKLFKYAGSR